MPANGQASSGYLVTTDTATLLLDCGPGVATALGAVTAPDQLSAVIVSHLHLDHCYDLLPVGKSLLSRGVRYPRAGEALSTGRRSTPCPCTCADPLPVYRHRMAARAPRRSRASVHGTIHLARPGMTFEVGPGYHEY